MVWTVIASKRKIEQLNIFDWLSNVKNLFLSNFCKYVQNVIHWELDSFFSQKRTKVAQRLGALLPDPIATGGFGGSPQTSVCDSFENYSLLNTSPKVDICTF